MKPLRVCRWLWASTACLLAAPALGQSDRALSLLRAQAYDEAVAVYRQIAEANPQDARAHYDLAATLGFLRRYQEAVEPVERAMRLAPEDPAAFQAAAIIYAHTSNPRAAFAATLHAAELGETTAMFELVWIYRDGRGVDPSAAASLHWAQRAAEQGHVAAMDLLSRAYLNGDFGAPIDADLARRWTLRAWEARRAGP